VSKTILIVDDEPEIVELLRIFLEREQIEIIEAFNGAEAWRQMERNTIDLAVIDIMMPQLDGYQLLKKIREKYKLPVIILSAKNQDADKILGLGLGADDFVAKPFNPLEVVARIQAQLRRSYEFASPIASDPQSNQQTSLGDLVLDHHSCEGVMICLIFPIFNSQIQSRLAEPTVSKIKANEIVRQDYTQIPFEIIESFGGWIEILDENLYVVYTKGNPADRRTSYTEAELISLFDEHTGATEYVSMAPFQTNEGRTYRCLVHIPQGYITKELQFHKTPASLMRTFIMLVLTTIALFLGLFGLNVYIYSRWTALKITNPLEAIASGMHNMANGRFRTRLAFKADYELAQIQDTFNNMAEQLEQSETEKRMLGESKQRMLVGISHDLKTPITTIQGYAKALQLGIVYDEGKRQKYLDYILNKSDLLTALIDDIFELSKLDSPDYILETELADVAEFVREIVAQFYDQFEEKQLFLQVQIPSSEIRIPFNAKMLYRALSNLLTNALKYCPARSEVLLQLLETESNIELNVIDNGPGIPDTLNEIIFDPFTRGDQARTSDGGTGLGLAIAKHVIEKHNGELQLDTRDGRTAFRMIFRKDESLAAQDF
jgi:signal transduction histidine kinase/DNA-binding NarL/FixJ family response regulator